MPRSHLHRLSLALFLLANMTLASRFRVSIQEIVVGTPRDIAEDDLLLAIATTTGFGTTNKTWLLGSAEADDVFHWDNLTMEVEVPASNSNLSVALGVLNDPDEDETVALKFVQGIVETASALLPIARFFETIIDFLGDLFDCDGPVVVDNVVYTSDVLNNFEQGQKECEKRNYTFPVKILVCGFTDSNYTVTHCLERLDSKSVAASEAENVRPDPSLSLLALTAALIYGTFELLL